MGNWNKLTRPWNMRVCIFQFSIDHKIRNKWLEKCYPKDKFNKSTRRICSIYCSIAPFVDNIKFPLINLYINNLMPINFYISLIMKRLFRSFDRHIDKTVTRCELLLNINKFRYKILDFFQKVSRRRLLNCSSYCDARLESYYFLKKSRPVNSSQFFFFNGSQNWVHLPIFYTLCCTRSRYTANTERVACINFSGIGCKYTHKCYI